jgi:hypothetical protein
VTTPPSSALPVIAKAPQVSAEERAAAERTKAIIAKAAADFEVRRKAEEEKIIRRNASDAVWEKAYGVPKADVSSVPLAPLDEAGRRKAAADAVWDRANSSVAAARQIAAMPSATSPAATAPAADAAKARANGDAVWDRVNANRDALLAHQKNGRI